jgi:hypothetical protein
MHYLLNYNYTGQLATSVIIIIIIIIIAIIIVIVNIIITFIRDIYNKPEPNHFPRVYIVCIYACMYVCVCMYVFFFICSMRFMFLLVRQQVSTLTDFKLPPSS